ncbi:hypothetical protein GCM10009753_35630 [Streptantibioticus ferralitis]
MLTSAALVLLPPALPHAAMDKAMETAAVAMTARRRVVFTGYLPDGAATLRPRWT